MEAPALDMIEIQADSFFMSPDKLGFDLSDRSQLFDVRISINTYSG